MKATPLRTVLAAFVLLSGAAVVAACGGGNASSYGVPVGPTPCPPGVPGTAPNCSQTQASNSFTPLSTATTAPLPGVGGFSGSILVPPAAAAAAITVGASTGAPAGVLPLQLAREGRRGTTAGGTITALLYITLTASGPVTFTGFPGFTITLPPALADAGPFYLAQLVNGAWTTIAGPVDPSGGTVTFPMLATGSLSIPAGGAVYFAVYNGGTIPTASPIVAPSGVATPSQSPIASPTPVASATGTSPSSPTPTPIPSGPPSSSTLPSPTNTPTIPPPPPPTATPTPTPFPTLTPTPAPSATSGGQSVASFSIGGIPSGQSGTSFSNQFLSFKAFNAQGVAITGAFANTVTVTSSDPSTTLSVNGGPASTSVQVTVGSQLIGLSYSGLAVNPVTITASASGATTATAKFAPVIAPLVYSGPKNASGNPEIDLYATSGTGSTLSFNVSQAGWTGSYGNSLTVPSSLPSACQAFMTLATPAPAASTFTVTVVPSPVPTSCAVGIGGFQQNLPVTFTFTTLGVQLQ